MLIQFFIRRLSLARQVMYLKKNAVYLGSRTREKRTPHLYMLEKRIIEVVFERDDINGIPEELIWLPTIQQLKSHLEKEFRASF
jgi:hypothetical protein